MMKKIKINDDGTITRENSEITINKGNNNQSPQNDKDNLWIKTILAIVGFASFAHWALGVIWSSSIILGLSAGVMLIVENRKI